MLGIAQAFDHILRLFFKNIVTVAAAAPAACIFFFEGKEGKLVNTAVCFSALAHSKFPNSQNINMLITSLAFSVF